MVLALPGRVDVYGAWPDLDEAISAMTLTAMRSGLDRRAVELINGRASQINGCPHCLDRHARASIDADWEPRHLEVVAAWLDAPWFTPDERSILALTDATVGSEPIDEQVVDEPRQRFGDGGMAKLLLAIVPIIAWNRVNVAAGIEPIDR
jgi:AhpD family alkylhydroperoxidase